MIRTHTPHSARVMRDAGRRDAAEGFTRYTGLSGPLSYAQRRAYASGVRYWQRTHAGRSRAVRGAERAWTRETLTEVTERRALSAA